jgi:murein DD-endopeptidase MepM/ murein hydrolase activator NlpD
MINLKDYFQVHIPIAKDGVYWNGKPDEFSNIYHNLNFSQEFGLTKYAQVWDKEKKNWTYGTFNGKPRPHNGNDYASNDIITLVTPYKVWTSYIGFDAGGYGNCCFMETETLTKNGETFKLEFVLGHLKDLPTISVAHWHEAGEVVGLMGNTGFSSGQHTHFGIRPWIKVGDGWQYLYPDDGARGYIDPVDLLIEKPIYDKQTLINEANFMATIDKKLIFNNDTGEIGWFYNKKLRVPKDTDRFVKMLGSYLVSKEGTNLSDVEFDKLPREDF